MLRYTWKYDRMLKEMCNLLEFRSYESATPFDREGRKIIDFIQKKAY